MEQEQSKDIFFYLKILLKQKKTLLIVSIATSLITAAMVFFVLDPIFYSSATLKTSSKGGGLGSILGGSIPDIGGLGDLAGGSSSSKELALFESILNSRRCLEQTIIKFKLNDEWKFKYFQDAVKHFRENVLEIKSDKLSGTIEIGVYDIYPPRAKEITEFLIEELNKINTELNVQSAKNNREFIEQRYNVVKEDLAKSEDSLRIFQDRYGFSPEINLRAASQAAIQLEAEIKTEEVKLDLLKQILSPNQSELLAQTEKINALRNQLSSIQNSTDDNSELKLKGAPEKVLNFVRLQRNVEIQNKILTYIVTLFEQAKIEEKKEMPSVLVIDQPYLPEKKVKPKRVVSILLTFAISLLLTSLLIIFYKTFFQSFSKKFNEK